MSCNSSSRQGFTPRRAVWVWLRFNWLVSHWPKRQHPQQYHFQATTLIRRKRQIPTPDQTNLIVKLYVFCSYLGSQFQQGIALIEVFVNGFRN